MFDEIKSIIPIVHPATPNRPDVFGTGTLIRIRAESFLLTAAHVWDEKSKAELYIPVPGGFRELQGRHLCTARRQSADRSDDLSDMCVIHLPTELANQVEKMFAFVPCDLLDSNEMPTDRTEYEFMGFPTSRSRVNTAAKHIRMIPYSFTSFPIPSRAIIDMGYNPWVHVLVHFKRQKNWNERGLRVTSPELFGVSGGAIWRVWRREGLFGDACTKRLVGIAVANKTKAKAMIGKGRVHPLPFGIKSAQTLQSALEPYLN